MPRATLPLHMRVRIEGRDARLAELGYSSYREYLRSPRWFDKRRAYRESDLPQECMCGSEDFELHHKTYERVGAEELSDLTPLCSKCHQMVHALERRQVITLDFQGMEDPMRAYLYRVQRIESVERAEAEAPLPLEDRVNERRRQRWKNKRNRKKMRMKNYKPD